MSHVHTSATAQSPRCRVCLAHEHDEDLISGQKAARYPQAAFVILKRKTDPTAALKQVLIVVRITSQAGSVSKRTWMSAALLSSSSSCFSASA